MNAGWFQSLAVQAMRAPVYASPLYPPSPYYRFLRLLAENVQPKLSVELGVCGGGGSLHLALGWPAGRVVGVDTNWLQWPEAIAHLEATCPNFARWQGDSVEAAAQIAATCGPVNILFVDTTHTPGQTAAEWAAWRPYLAARAVACFDDLFRPGMNQAWNDLPEPKVRLDFLHDGSPGIGGGFGVVWNT